MISSFQIKEWDPEQLAAFAKAAFKKFGEAIKEWPSDAFIKLKEILSGIDAGELAKMGADVFKKRFVNKNNVC